MTTYTESFNTSDGDTLGPDLTWVEVTGDADIVSNRARVIEASGTVSVARADHALASNDQYCQLKLYLPAGTAIGGGPILRKGANSTITFYMVWVDWSGGVYRMTAYKYVAGTLTAIGSTVSSLSFTSGDTVRGEVEGTTIRGYVNGSLILTRTDSSISSGVNCGFRLYDNSAVVGVPGNVVEVDDWEAGDLGATVPSLSSLTTTNIATTTARLGLTLTF